MRKTYADLNLTGNPFAVLDGEELGQVAVLDFNVDAVLDKLQRPGFAIQFLGLRGRGKTTHLTALHNYFSNLPQTYIELNQPPPPIPEAPIVFVDELQRLPLGQRRELFRRNASFVIGSHWHHGLELFTAGVRFQTVWLRGLSLGKLRRIVGRRMAEATLDTGRPVFEVSDRTLRSMLWRHGDNLRAIQGSLYDLIEKFRDGRP